TYTIQVITHTPCSQAMLVRNDTTERRCPTTDSLCPVCTEVSLFFFEFLC
ncbi:hypothetical protein BaRGS_00004080, partial [Batillaria attramentaria]